MLNGIDAMKDMNAGGILRSDSQTQDGQLLISVSDTGVGLPPTTGSGLQCILYYQAPWHRHGLVHQPFYRSNHTAVDCGLLPTSSWRNLSPLSLPMKDEAHDDPADLPTVFVIDDDALVRAAISKAC